MVTFKNDEGQTLGHMVYSKVQHFVAKNTFSEYKNIKLFMLTVNIIKLWI